MVLKKLWTSLSFYLDFLSHLNSLNIIVVGPGNAIDIVCDNIEKKRLQDQRKYF